MWDTCGLHDNLSLPVVNEFIPTDFDLVPREAEVSPLFPLINFENKVWILANTGML